MPLSVGSTEKKPAMELAVFESPVTPKSDGSLSRAPIDKALERKLLMKLDLRVIPILWVLFLVSFFDRSNIGNAKIAGMTQSLHLKGNDYNIAVTIFTVSYVVFAVPANLLVKKFGPKMLAVYMFCWGTEDEASRHYGKVFGR